MSGAIAKIVGKRILGETTKNHFGKEDPYFERVPATRLDGRPSTKTKKRRKALPPGISEHDARILTKVKRRAYRLDMSLFNCCGIRFGWGSVIGIVPAIGDVLDTCLAAMVVRTCNEVEGHLPPDLRMRMLMNIAFDFVIGLVPFLGDLADAMYKCNTRNAVLLEKYLRKQGELNVKRAGQRLPAVDPSLPEEYDNDDDDLGPPPRYDGVVENNRTRTIEPARPEIAQVPTETRGGLGWFGGSRRDRPDDLEMGEGPPPQQPPRRGDKKLKKQDSRR